jgi:hypothetical protein
MVRRSGSLLQLVAGHVSVHDAPSSLERRDGIVAEPLEPGRGCMQREHAAAPTRCLAHGVSPIHAALGVELSIRQRSG